MKIPFHVVTAGTFLFVCLPFSKSSNVVEKGKDRLKGHAEKETCPGSPSWEHAKCKMVVKFHNVPCSTVEHEINLRLTSPDWVDPHNHGQYGELEDKYDKKGGDYIKGQRLSGNKKYIDLFTFSLTPDHEFGGCRAIACSESQVLSILDFNTNYCNLRNLYCNSHEGCNVMEYELGYEEELIKCGQHKKEACISIVDES